mgnify:CR=1 FL=1
MGPVRAKPFLGARHEVVLVGHPALDLGQDLTAGLVEVPPEVSNLVPEFLEGPIRLHQVVQGVPTPSEEGRQPFGVVVGQGRRGGLTHRPGGQFLDLDGELPAQARDALGQHPPTVATEPRRKPPGGGNPDLVDDQGVSISADCTLCHSILAFESPSPFHYLEPIQPAQPDSAMHIYLQQEFTGVR